jgi:D-3-phosphoglycerate dehydrogenase
VDAALIAALKPGTILVNTSRGKCLDQAAVDAALRSGHLAAAALDVYEVEPLPADDPIRSAPNVILTPHHASFSDEAMDDLRAEMCRTTIDFITTGWSSAIVNPEVRGRLRR